MAARAAIAVAMALAFFLYYAVRIKSVPLGIIIFGVLACLVYEFIESVRDGRKPPGG